MGLIKTSQPALHGDQHKKDGSDPIPGIGCCDTGIPGVAYDDYVTSLSNLLGYWRLGEASSPFADTSGRFPGSPGDATRVTRGTAYTPDQTGALPTADDDGAILFNSAGSAGDYLQVTNGASGRYDFASGSGSFTVAAWIKVKAHASTFTGAVIHNRYSSPPDGWALHVNWPARTVTFFIKAIGGSTFTVTSPTLIADSWYHVAGVYDDSANTIELFVNGISAASASSVTAVLPAWNNGPQIGGGHPNASTDFYFYGTIDEVALWDAVLTPAEIAGLYDAGSIGSPGSSESAGKVLTSDGEGGTTYAYPTVNVDGTRYDEILTGSNLTSTNNTDGTVTIDATGGGGTFDPATATTWWFPLADSDGLLVLDDSGALIPTLIPI